MQHRLSVPLRSSSRLSASRSCPRNTLGGLRRVASQRRWPGCRLRPSRPRRLRSTSGQCRGPAGRIASSRPSASSAHHSRSGSRREGRSKTERALLFAEERRPAEGHQYRPDGCRASWASGMPRSHPPPRCLDPHTRCGHCPRTSVTSVTTGMPRADQPVATRRDTLVRPASAGRPGWRPVRRCRPRPGLRTRRLRPPQGRRLAQPEPRPHRRRPQDGQLRLEGSRTAVTEPRRRLP